MFDQYQWISPDNVMLNLWVSESRKHRYSHRA
ncbi:hypothetical protein FOCG_00498 [Fusarium oxysporum f. sp. radicis-lycopersici 26381]|nr:hypothetical protein FOWG_02890 [Fusarium oxysporum f. sp. lycopersici MN25]EXL61360.1 hypothetical protein FOCG_00498 [Fusarium oxysporum f. sp. radicis-lycopersici 26381]